MSTTRGVMYVHSAPSALCPHIEWALGGLLGVPTRLTWTAQEAERNTYRAELSWTGPDGTAVRADWPLADAKKPIDTQKTDTSQKFAVRIQPPPICMSRILRAKEQGLSGEAPPLFSSTGKP